MDEAQLWMRWRCGRDTATNEMVVNLVHQLAVNLGHEMIVGEMELWSSYKSGAATPSGYGTHQGTELQPTQRFHR